MIRPQTEELHDYRGYAGQILSGQFKKGDRIHILPAGLTSLISKIEVNGAEKEEVFEGQPAVIHIAHDLDISRGDVFTAEEELPYIEKDLKVLLCWLDQKPLQPGNKYILQQNSRQVKTIVKDIEYKINVNTLNREQIENEIKLNEIVKVTLRTAQPLVYDSFSNNKTTGAAILVDETSNSTVAACIIQ